MLQLQHGREKTRQPTSGRNYQCVPKVFEKDGYRFFFYSNEHRPIHVHVRYGSGEAVFAVEPEVELRESVALKVRELARAEQLARENQALIIAHWHEHIG